MKIYTSAWVAPVSSPTIRRGAVAVEDGRIVAVGPAESVLAELPHGMSAGFVQDLGDAVLIPALVNAHTHLELSWMSGEGLPRGDFLTWVHAMIGRRAASAREIETSLTRAIDGMRAAGTALVGDVGNTLAALPVLRSWGSSGRFFLEIVGAEPGRARELYERAARLLDASADPSVSPHARPSAPASPLWSITGLDERGGRGLARRGETGVTASLTPHGPHSVSRELLERLATRARERGEWISVHLAESRPEVDLLLRGEGPFLPLLEEMGAIDASWRAPGRTPAELLDDCGLLGPRTLAVHGVHLTRGDARLIAVREATVVLCPRSNAWLCVGTAPVAMLLEEGVRLALGTDSLASNDDLDLRSELACLRGIAPSAPPEALLRAATLGGAEALGFADELGSIEPGKRAALVALTRVGPAGDGTRTGTGSTPASAPAPNGWSPSTARDDEPYATLFAPAGNVQVTLLDSEDE